MEIEIILGGFILGIIAGGLSAAFGIGGAMLIIPALRIFFGLTGHEAIATTIPLTIPTTLTGAITFHMKGLVKVKTALIAGSVGIGFSIVGAYMTGLFHGSVLMWGLVGLFFFLAIITWKKVEEQPKKQTKKAKALRSASIGAVGGFLNGFFGIGGGAIVVPLLMKIRGLSIKVAVPTSLAIIVIYSTSSTIAHFAIGNIVMDVLMPVMVGAVIGVLLMSEKISEINEDTRKKAFVVFMVLMGISIAVKEIVG